MHLDGKLLKQRVALDHVLGTVVRELRSFQEEVRDDLKY